MRHPRGSIPSRCTFPTSRPCTISHHRRNTFRICGQVLQAAGCSSSRPFSIGCLVVETDTDNADHDDATLGYLHRLHRGLCDRRHLVLSLLSQMPRHRRVCRTACRRSPTGCTVRASLNHHTLPERSVAPVGHVEPSLPRAVSHRRIRPKPSALKRPYSGKQEKNWNALYRQRNRRTRSKYSQTKDAGTCTTKGPRTDQARVLRCPDHHTGRPNLPYR